MTSANDFERQIKLVQNSQTLERILLNPIQGIYKGGNSIFPYIANNSCFFHNS